MRSKITNYYTFTMGHNAQELAEVQRIIPYAFVDPPIFSCVWRWLRLILKVIWASEVHSARGTVSRGHRRWYAGNAQRTGSQTREKIGGIMSLVPLPRLSSHRNASSKTLSYSKNSSHFTSTTILAPKAKAFVLWSRMAKHPICC